MTFEYKCSSGHITEQFFRSISAADAAKHQPIDCTVCGERAELVEFSTTLAPHLYGGGFYNGSPTKRHSWKLATEKGNKDSAG